MNDKNNISLAIAYIIAIAQAVAVGFSFLAAKVGLQSADMFDLLAWRFIFAMTTLLAFMRFIPHPDLGLPAMKAIMPRGLVFPVAAFLFQAMGLKCITSSQSGIINSLIPIVTCILAVLILGTRVSRFQVGCIIISIAGVIFINVMNGLTLADFSAYGVAVTFISMMMLSTYNILAQQVAAVYTPLTISFGLNLTGFLCFGTAALCRHIADGSLVSFFEPLTHPAFLASVLFLSIVCSAGTAIMNAYALKVLTSVDVGLFNNLTTIVSLAAGVIILHDAFHWYHLVGIVVIVVSTVFYNLDMKKQHDLANQHDAANM